MKRLLYGFMVTFVLSGCGGDNGGSSQPISNNSSGFPDVSGRYSFNTSKFDVSCADGSEGTNPALALNFNVSQNINELTLLNTTNGGSVPSITIIDSTGLSGNIQKNASFIISQILTANITGVSSIVNINYNIAGDFTSDGWSGTYEYTVSSSSLTTCTSTASFTGSKLPSTSTAILKFQIKPYGLSVDIYDSFSAIGSNIGFQE